MTSVGNGQAGLGDEVGRYESGGAPAADAAAGRAAGKRAGRIQFLEAVRGIAALIVVVHHVAAVEFPAFAHWTHDHIDLGRVGVVAFFLVSGYVIPLSLAGQTVRTFAVRRFFRLFPVYWVAFAVYALTQWRDVADATHIAVADATPIALLLNLLMVQGLVGVVSILPPAWTLSIELLYYVQSALAKVRVRLNAAVHMGWFWLALYAALAIAERVLNKHLPTSLSMLMFVASLGHALHIRDRDGTRSHRMLT